LNWDRSPRTRAHDSDREADLLKAPFVTGARISAMTSWTCHDIRQSLATKSRMENGSRNPWSPWLFRYLLDIHDDGNLDSLL